MHTRRTEDLGNSAGGTRTRLCQLAAAIALLALPASAGEVASADAPARSVPVGLRVGLVMPGSLAPHGLLLTRTNVAPLFAADVSGQWRWFSVGALVQLAPLSGPATLRDAARGSASYTVLSVNAVTRFTWHVAESFTLRAGAVVGLHFIFGSATFEGSDVCRTSSTCNVGSTGVGVNVAPTVDASYRVAGQWWLVAQLSFFSQPPPLGVAWTSDGLTRAYTFAPFGYFALGAEYRL